jgi:P-type Ca2+ transporter type 2C
MTMAFAFVSLTAVNLGVVMRREREAPWSSPLFPYFGWIILGWLLTWAAVGLSMFQRLLDTVTLSGGQWLVVMGLSVVTPLLVALDKGIQSRRQAKAGSLASHAP